MINRRAFVVSALLSALATPVVRAQPAGLHSDEDRALVGSVADARIEQAEVRSEPMYDQHERQPSIVVVALPAYFSPSQAQLNC